MKNYSMINGCGRERNTLRIEAEGLLGRDVGKDVVVKVASSGEAMNLWAHSSQQLGYNVREIKPSDKVEGVEHGVRFTVTGEIR